MALPLFKPRKAQPRRGANVSNQSKSKGTPGGGDVSCTVKVRSPGGATSAYVVRGKPTERKVKPCMAAHAAQKKRAERKR